MCVRDKFCIYMKSSEEEEEEEGRNWSSKVEHQHQEFVLIQPAELLHLHSALDHKVNSQSR